MKFFIRLLCIVFVMVVTTSAFFFAAFVQVDQLTQRFTAQWCLALVLASLLSCFVWWTLWKLIHKILPVRQYSGVVIQTPARRPSIPRRGPETVIRIGGGKCWTTLPAPDQNLSIGNLVTVYVKGFYTSLEIGKDATWILGMPWWLRS